MGSGIKTENHILTDRMEAGWRIELYPHYVFEKASQILPGSHPIVYNQSGIRNISHHRSTQYGTGKSIASLAYSL